MFYEITRITQQHKGDQQTQMVINLNQISTITPAGKKETEECYIHMNTEVIRTKGNARDVRRQLNEAILFDKFAADYLRANADEEDIHMGEIAENSYKMAQWMLTARKGHLYQKEHEI